MDEARPRFDEGTALVLRALDTGVMEAYGPVFTQPRAALRPRPTRTFCSERQYKSERPIDNARRPGRHFFYRRTRRIFQPGG